MSSKGYKKIEESESGNDEGIIVAIRLRPLDNKERSNKTVWKVLPQYFSITQTNPDGQDAPERVVGRTYFTYDKTFDASFSTRKVYDNVASGIVSSALMGLNGTLFAYGQTASGKTYTMKGDGNNIKDGSTPSEEGIIHMAARDVFDKIEKNKDRTSKVRVSFIEVYNEEVRDLLSESGQVLQIREDPKRGVFVQSARDVEVTTLESLLELLLKGEKRQIVAATTMNERSSRSHAILRITIESKENSNSFVDSSESDGDDDVDVERMKNNINNTDSGPVIISALNFVDLAGSESVRHTGATGHRQKEGGKINTSLLALSRVIDSLGNPNHGHTNFRDSKLTRILQPSLMGNARMAIICCVTPSELYLEETRSTLQFASRAKLVKTRAVVNEVISDRDQIKRLQRELTKSKKEANSENEKLLNALHVKSKVYDLLQNQYEDLRKERLRHAFDIAKLNVERGHLRENNEDDKKKIMEMSHTIRDQKIREQKIREQSRQDSNTEDSQDEKRNTILEKKLNETKLENESLRRRVLTLTRENVESQAELTGRSAQISLLEADLKNTRADHAAKQHSIIVLTQQREQAAAKLNMKTGQTKTLKKNLNDTRAEFQLLKRHSSKSLAVESIDKEGSEKAEGQKESNQLSSLEDTQIVSRQINEAAAEISERDETISSLKNDLINTRENIKALKQTIADLSSKLESQNEEASEQSKEKKKSKEFSSLETELSKARVENGSLALGNSDLCRQLEESKAAFTEQSQIMASLKDDIKNNRVDNESNQQAIQKKSHQLEEEIAKVCLQEKDLALKEQDIAKLQAKIDSGGQNNLNASMEEELSDLEAEIETLKKANTDLLHKVESKKQDDSTLSVQYIELQIKFEKQSERIVSLESDMSNTKSLKQTIADLSSKLESQNEEISEQSKEKIKSKEFSSLETELSKARVENGSLALGNSDLCRQLEESKAAFTEQSQKIVSLENDIKNNRVDNESNQQAIQKKSHQLEEEIAKVCLLEKDLALKEQDIVNLQDEIDSGDHDTNSPLKNEFDCNQENKKLSRKLIRTENRLKERTIERDQANVKWDSTRLQLLEIQNAVRITHETLLSIK